MKDRGISVLSSGGIERHLSDLGELLHASVHQGASIGFLLPFSETDGIDFWRDTVEPAVRASAVLLLVAYQNDKVIGSVQLGYNTPANQPHRADVMKLMVHPAHRRQGIARALMVELEHHAKKLDRSLLTLDTRSGDGAEPLYTSLGFQTVGMIPNFCKDTLDHNRLDPTTIMYKLLDQRTTS